MVLVAMIGDGSTVGNGVGHGGRGSGEDGDGARETWVKED